MKALFLCSFFILLTMVAYAQFEEQDSLRREKKALRQAQKIRKQLLKGADFHQLAEKHSDDPGSAPYGGKLGTVHFGQFVPEFEETLRALDPGEISPPVRTKFGYHLIELIALEGEQFTSRHILIKP